MRLFAFLLLVGVQATPINVNLLLSALALGPQKSSRAYIGRGPNAPPVAAKTLYPLATEPVFNGEFYELQHHMLPVSTKSLEEEFNLLGALDSARVPFLYLSSSRAIRSLVDALPLDQTSFDKESVNMTMAETALLNYLKQSIHLPKSLRIGETASLLYLSTKPTHSNHNRPQPNFHLDPLFDDAEFRLNVWIATEDVRTQPLAFVKPESVVPERIQHRRVSSLLEYDQDHEYVFVPSMKAYEMLVFKGTHVYHGVPFFPPEEGFNGDRVCVVASLGIYPK